MTVTRRFVSLISSARCQCTHQSRRSFHQSSIKPVELQPIELVGNFASSAQGKILNTTLRDRKPVVIELQSIYGIGEHQARIICGDLGLNPNTIINQMTMSGFMAMRQMIETKFEPKHLQQKALGQTILAKIKIGSYQGVRHTQMLPVHGQRTQTNAKNARKFGRLRASAFQLPLFNKKKGGKTEKK